ncbi:hypothetical protein EV1_040123 [Malus domestica]
MEKHECKICMRSFPNGRALGGHMRSHVRNHPIPPKPEEKESNREQTQFTMDEVDNSASASSSSEDDGEEEDDDMIYGLRENPKRSIKLVDPEDPEFSFAAHAGSVVLQDRESETESSKNPTRRRSKRTRKSSVMELHHHHNHIQYHHHQKLEALKKIKLKNKVVSSKDSFEPEPVSSISDATREEDVAFCLMMLSRDKWRKQDHNHQHEQEQEQEQADEAERSMEDTEDSEEHLIKFPRIRTARRKYKCETCNKVFKSYQALGGHRASHKKIKASNLNPIYEPELEQENLNAAGNSSSVAERKIHECPVCFRVFSSGQALGGHKRSHVMTGSAAAAASNSSPPFPWKSLSRLGDSLIDLNLPAPVDDDEISQFELSAVSDAEFVNHVRR